MLTGVEEVISVSDGTMHALSQEIVPLCGGCGKNGSQKLTASYTAVILTVS